MIDSLIHKTVQERPFNAEAPLEALNTVPTPTQLFFIRSNFDIPQIDRDAWRLRVTGAVAREREFSFADLQRFERTEALVLLECAGNGRRRMVPVPSGVAWDVGAVSCAVFGGIVLADVLDACEPSADAVEVLFTGADRGEVSAGREIAFERSLPIEKARDRAVLLAHDMNGAPLTREHGFPVRLLVPDWYAVSSVKWITEMRVLTTPFHGHFQTERYIYIDDPIAAQQEPVRETRVRAVIAQPHDGAELRAGEQTVKGIAWSGAAPVRSVEISTDNGGTWDAAEMDRPASPSGPVTWAFVWNAGPGPHTILARATDAVGNTQPVQPIFNQLGYGNNVVHSIEVIVQ